MYPSYSKSQVKCLQILTYIYYLNDTVSKLAEDEYKCMKL